MEVLDTDYKSYAVIFATRVKDGRTLHMMRLYSTWPSWGCGHEGQGGMGHEGTLCCNCHWPVLV